MSLVASAGEITEADALSWITSHNLRKTTATILGDAGLSARQSADQLGHARPSLTQDMYMARRAKNRAAAAALEDAIVIRLVTKMPASEPERHIDRLETTGVTPASDA